MTREYLKDQKIKWNAISRALKSPDKEKVLSLSHDILSMERERTFTFNTTDNFYPGSRLYKRINEGHAVDVYEYYIEMMEKKLDDILLKYVD